MRRKGREQTTRDVNTHSVSFTSLSSVASILMRAAAGAPRTAAMAQLMAAAKPGTPASAAVPAPAEAPTSVFSSTSVLGNEEGGTALRQRARGSMHVSTGSQCRAALRT